MNPFGPLRLKIMRRKVNPSLLLKRRGFTLVEVMISLTILGLMILMIFGAFRLGLSAWEKGESVSEDYQKIRVISRLISQQMKSVVPYKIKSKKAEGDYLAFEGKEQSLKFVSALPFKTRQPEGFVYVTYVFKKEGEKAGQLLLHEQRALNRDFIEEEPNQERSIPLLKDISEIRFEYYREEDKAKDQSEKWLKEWDAKEEKRLPKALKMTITSDRRSGKQEDEPLIIILTSLPANRFEEIRATAIIRRPVFERPR